MMARLMPIRVTCTCGKSLNAPDTLAGKKAKCPGCGRVLSIPGAGAAAAKAPAPAAKPTAAKPAPAVAKPAPKPALGGTTQIVMRPPSSAAKLPPSPELHNHASCPSCNAFVSKKDALCVQCGMNLVTGRKLTTVHSKEPTGPAKNVATTCLVLNIFPLPGVGTLIGGGKDERMHGLLQLITYLVGVAFWNPWYPGMYKILEEGFGGGLIATILGPLLTLGGMGWGAWAGVEILKNAKPDAGQPTG